MPSTSALSRRDLIRLSAMTAVSLPFLGTVGAAEGPNAASPVTKSWPLKLGVAGVSLRELSVENAIAGLKGLNIQNVSLHRAQIPWDGTAEECVAVAQKFRDGGFTLSGSGVINLPDDEAAARKAFDNVRAVGLPVMICKPEVKALPLLDRLVKEYDLRLAVHNHGPEDKVFPSPYDVWKAIEPFDRRIGLCLDVGHTLRAGIDPAAALRQCAARLYDVHLKDMVRTTEGKEVPVEVGRGEMDIRGILIALKDIKFDGVVQFEYERRGVNPIVGLAESIGYVRGVLSGL